MAANFADGFRVFRNTPAVRIGIVRSSVVRFKKIANGFYFPVFLQNFAGRIKAANPGVRFAFRSFRRSGGASSSNAFHFSGEGSEGSGGNVGRALAASGWVRVASAVAAGSGVWCRRHTPTHTVTIFFVLGSGFQSLLQGTTRIPFDHGPNCGASHWSSLMSSNNGKPFPLILEPRPLMFFPTSRERRAFRPTGVKSRREVRSPGRSRGPQRSEETAVKIWSKCSLGWWSVAVNLAKGSSNRCCEYSLAQSPIDFIS